MFGDVGFGEILVILVLALFIFGPDRLPKMASELGKGLRQVRRMATNARRDLRDGMGPEMDNIDIDDLNPRRFVRKHLLEPADDDEDDDYEPASRSHNGHRGKQLDPNELPPYDVDAT